MSYSVWLVPAATARARFQAAVDALCARHGQPAFPAHVPLLPQGGGAAEPQLAAACAALAAAHAPFAAGLAPAATAGLDAQHWHFRCVYALLEECAPLLALRAAAEARLAPAAGAYMPHLSLVYSECDAGARRAWAAGAAAEVAGLGGAFPCDALQLWDTASADVASWRLVREFPLGE